MRYLVGLLKKSYEHSSIQFWNSKCNIKLLKVLRDEALVFLLEECLFLTWAV